MKKILSLVIVLSMLLTVATIFPTHAAKKNYDPIAFGYTSEFKDFPGYPTFTADDGVGYLASYNASKDAIEFTGFAGSGFYPGSGFSNLVVDTSVYKYMKVEYQANCVNGANACFAIAFGGSVWAGVRLEWGIPSTSSFTTKVIDLTDNATQINGVSVMNPDALLGNWDNYPDLHAEGGMTMSFNYADLGGSPMVATDTIYVKYVAFFADKDSADDFDIADYTPDADVYDPQPEESEPEVSEPEASQPEASQPEASQPEASQPEASEPEASEPEASEPEASEPEASEPEASEPEASEPEASEPEAEPEPEKPLITVFDWTKADTASPVLNNLGYCWNGIQRGTSEFDAAESAWKLEMTKDIDAWYGAFADRNLEVGIDLTEYKYAKICYKTAGFNNAGNHILFHRFGNAWGSAVLEFSDNWTEAIIDTSVLDTKPGEVDQFESLGIVFNGYTLDQSAGESLPTGAKMWIKYIAFFKTEEEAKAFTELSPEGVGSPETSTPESSAPESSAPESSAPESSAPETSAPESSVVESSSSDNGGSNGGNAIIYIVIAAVVVAAIVVVVVIFSKKKKA